MMKTINKVTAITVLAACAAVAVQAAPYVILQNGSRKVGSDIRAKSNGDIVLRNDSGQMMTFTRNQVKQAVADKPAEYDQAIAAIRGGDLDRAIPLLNSIVRQYQYLGWDERAIPLLAQVYIKQGNYRQAVSAYERMLRNNPDLVKKPDVVKEYWNALLKTENYSELEDLLDDMIATGPRDGAAAAQIMRGDMKAARGAQEDALLDYMRTVVFFKQQTDLLPEALFKAGQTLKKMRDPRAEKMFNTLVNEYPQSEYASQVGQ